MSVKLTTRDICFIGLLVAAISVLSLLSIPLPGGVPMTLQTFAIAFAAAVCGAKKGALAALIYVLLGAVGVPVFAGFMGGFHIIVGPTGGYLLSLPVMAFIIGFFADRKNLINLAFGLIAASAINLSIGTLQFSVVAGLSLRAAFFAAFAPFVLIEMIKMVVVFITAPVTRKLLEKHHAFM